MSSFLLSWLLPGLPIVYLLRSSLASLMYWFGISWYAALGYLEYPNQTPWLFLPLALLALPAYRQHWLQMPDSNFTRFHHLVLPLSAVVALGAFGSGSLMVAAYIALFGILLWVGSRPALGSSLNGYRLLGTLGLVILLLVLSFRAFWTEWAREPLIGLVEGRQAQALLFNGLLWGSLIVLALRSMQKTSFVQDGLLAGALLFLPVLLIGRAEPLLGQVATNLLLLAISVAVMWQGTRHDDLRQLNLGLLSLTALIACRFFDMNLSFGLRGLLFVLLGLGFFFVNYRILQKRKHRA
jgi:hypothetical protein